MEDSIERARLKLEQKSLEGELELRKAEIALRRDELEAKKAQEAQKRLHTVSPLTTGIIAAVVGLIGTGLGAYIQGRSQLDIERLKFESNLILKAIETGNREESRNNLVFLIEAGFIEDKQGKIVASAKDPEKVPVLPMSSPNIDVETLKLKRLTDKLGLSGNLRGARLRIFSQKNKSVRQSL